jgi:hypothetical protein
VKKSNSKKKVARVEPIDTSIYIVDADGNRIAALGGARSGGDPSEAGVDDEPTDIQEGLYAFVQAVKRLEADGVPQDQLLDALIKEFDAGDD